jgi:hypothetical protein
MNGNFRQKMGINGSLWYFLGIYGIEEVSEYGSFLGEVGLVDLFKEET